MTDGTLLILSLLIPLMGVVLIGLAGLGHRGEDPTWCNVREGFSLTTASALFLTVLTLYEPVLAGLRPSLHLWTMMPGLEIRLTVEPFGLLFATLASFLWIVTTIYSIGYMRGHKEKHQTRFYLFFAIAIASVMGVAFSGNMLTLFLFYETLSISTFPLVTHNQTPEAKRAGRIYLAILMGTSMVFLLPAMIGTWEVTGTLNFTSGGIFPKETPPMTLSILLILYLLGIGKAALMPFHRWLPAAMIAPTPVSALLHAVAVVKTGVFAVIKVALYLFGLDLLQEIEATRWILYSAGATILIASLIAMQQDNLKRRLAYSTISQLAYIVLGAMLANKNGIIGGGLHMFMHAFGKITLFFGAGAILIASHKSEISQMNGIGKQMPITLITFFIGSLSIIGLPPFGGLWSKWFLALGTLDAGEIILLALLMVSSLLNVAYLLPIVIRGFFYKPHESAHAHPPHGEAPLPCLIAQIITATGCFVLFFIADPIYRLLATVVE